MPYLCPTNGVKSTKGKASSTRQITEYLWYTYLASSISHITLSAKNNWSNLTKRPHRHHTWTVQSYSSGGANMHPPSNTCLLGPTPVHIPNGILIGSAVFPHLMADSPYTLQWVAPTPSKLPFHRGELDSHLIYGSLSPSKSTSQTTSWSVHPFFAGLTNLRDRPHYCIN